MAANDERKPLLDNSEKGPFAPAAPSQNIATGASELHSQIRSSSGIRVNRRVADRISVNTLSRRPSENGQPNHQLNPNTTSNSWHVRWALVTILVSVVLERVTFYGLTGNLVLFLNLQPFTWESYHAMNAMFTFFGITYILALIGGWVADSFLGRFKAMLFAYVIYVFGYVFLPFMASKTVSDTKNMTRAMPYINRNGSLPTICGNSVGNQGDGDNPFTENCAWLVFVVLIIIGIGCGVLKANICPFGSDQLTRANQQTQLSFFNWYYWCVNLGSFIGLGGVAYIEQQSSFRTGYIICTSCLCVSGFVFLLGRCCYLSRPPDGSVLSNIFKIIREAWRRKRQRQQLVRISRQSASERAQGEIDEASQIHENINFLDYAKHRNGGIFHNSLVDDVKKLKIILIVFGVLIPYWIVYFQMQTTFLIQGLHMKLDFSSSPSKHPASSGNSNLPPTDLKYSNRPEIVAAWFTLFDALFVIILLPLFDRVIYPRMSRAGYPFTFAKRIILGMLFAIAAMIVAGIVEHVRLGKFWPNSTTCVNASINQYIGNTPYEAADLSVFWQIPQYALIGISEVFASVACLQFAVTVAPKSMKAIITGLFYFFSGIGSLLGVAIVSVLSSYQIWFASHDFGNINCSRHCNPNVKGTGCHLDYYFYFLAGLEFVALLLFLLVVRAFGLNTNELGLNSHVREAPAERNVQRANNTSSSSS